MARIRFPLRALVCLRRASFLVTAEDSGVRLDTFLRAQYRDAPRVPVQIILRKKRVLVNDSAEQCLGGYRVAASDRITVSDEDDAFLRSPGDQRRVSVANRPRLPEKQFDLISSYLRPRLTLLDDRFAHLDKPPGLCVQGGPTVLFSLADVIEAWAESTGPLRLVHRLDSVVLPGPTAPQDTTGSLVLARNRQAAEAVNELFRECRVEKQYVACLASDRVPVDAEGAPRLLESFIDSSEVVSFSVQGRAPNARTEYTVVGQGRGVSWVLFRPVTGRKHQVDLAFFLPPPQLRLQSAELLRAPIVGDAKFGDRKHNALLHAPRQRESGLPRAFDPRNPLFLHCLSVSFALEDGLRSFYSPLPRHFRAALESWRCPECFLSPWLLELLAEPARD